VTFAFSRIVWVGAGILEVRGGNLDFKDERIIRGADHPMPGYDHLLSVASERRAARLARVTAGTVFQQKSIGRRGLRGLGQDKQ
jgi:hypothetical protein